MNRLFYQYIRNFRAHKLNFGITLIGFSLSMAVVVILLFFILAEKSYDKAYKNIDNIYMAITNDNEFYVEEDARDILIDKFPQIESACRYNSTMAILVSQDNFFEGRAAVTDEGFFDVFSLDFIHGNKNTVFSDKNGIVLTESFAKKIFDENYPLGELVKLTGGKEFFVTGVVKDLPERSSLKADCFVNFKSRIVGNGYNDVFRNGLFIHFKPNCNFNDIESQVNGTLLKNSRMVNEYKENKTWFLFPFKDAYFHNAFKKDMLGHANLKLIQIIATVSLIVLILSIINYINLSITSSHSRVKEIGVRKTIGANKKVIFRQFLSESIITCFLAVFLAFGFAYLLLPIVEIILTKPVDFDLFTPFTLVLIFSGTLFIGVISGAIPAVLASNFSPLQIFSRNRLFKKNSIFQQGLNTLQFSISIIMIICLLVILKQIEYVKKKDIGYNTQNLIRVEFPSNTQDKKQSGTIRNILCQNPYIENVSFSYGTPMHFFSYVGSERWKDEKFAVLITDNHFINTFGLKLLHGRNMNYPSKQKECLISQKTFELTGWDNFEGEKLDGVAVVGVVNTFDFDDLHDFPGYAIMQNCAIRSDKYTHANIKLKQGNTALGIKHIQQVWNNQFPDFGFRYEFYDDWVNNNFQKEENHARIVIVFGLLSIVLSCLGLFGMTDYSIKQRIKEIGIRKVNGAYASEILVLLNSDFIKWVLLSCIIACPIGYYVITNWLKNFAYKTELSWWIFALSGIIAMCIAIITISWHCWRAANRNPVEALRYE